MVRESSKGGTQADQSMVVLEVRVTVRGLEMKASWSTMVVRMNGMGVQS